MSDLLAECDWHDSTLFLVLPEDPERIGVRLFPSRYAPSRMYMPEAEIVLTKAENAKLREQMERLVTLLRNDCDIEASWDGLRHFWSIELTDDGCLMRDRACKAEAENAKLVDVLHEVETDAVYAYHCLQSDIELVMKSETEFFEKWWHSECRNSNKLRRIEVLEAENAKLRELAEKLHRCARGALRDLAPSCTDLSVDGCGMDCTDNGEKCCMALLEQRMRELGSELGIKAGE